MAFLRLVVATIKLPQGGLDSAVVTLREGVRVLLKYSGSICTLLSVKILMEPIPSPIGPRASGKGAGSIRRAFWKAATIYLSRSSSRWDFHFHSYVLTI